MEEIRKEIAAIAVAMAILSRRLSELHFRLAIKRRQKGFK